MKLSWLVLAPGGTLVEDDAAVSPISVFTAANDDATIRSYAKVFWLLWSMILYPSQCCCADFIFVALVVSAANEADFAILFIIIIVIIVIIIIVFIIIIISIMIFIILLFVLLLVWVLYVLFFWLLFEGDVYS